MQKTIVILFGFIITEVRANVQELAISNITVEFFILRMFLTAALLLWYIKYENYFSNHQIF